MALAPVRRAAVGTAALAVVAAGAALVSPSAAVRTLGGVTADPVAFAAVLVVLYLVRPVFAWPTTLLSVLIGYGYGVAVGLPVALAGTVLTSLPVFAAASWCTGGAADEGGSRGRIGRALGGLEATGERYFEAAGGLRGVTAARLAPVPADAVTAAAAAAGVSPAAFAAGTVAGEVPWTVAAVLVGDSANRLSTGDLGAVGLPLAVGAALAAGLLLAPPAYRLLAERRSRGRTDS